jgi:hypothetical protein
MMQFPAHRFHRLNAPNIPCDSNWFFAGASLCGGGTKIPLQVAPSPTYSPVFCDMGVINLCIYPCCMAAAQRKALYKMRLPDGEGMRVGQFAKWKRKWKGVPEILRSISSFNAGHSTSLRMLCPKTAEIVLNPANAFPNNPVALAKSMLNMMNFPNSYMFEEGVFPTSMAFAYPAFGMKLPKEVHMFDSSGNRFVFPTGKYAGMPMALLAPGVSYDMLAVADGEIRLNFPEEKLLPFPCFPESLCAAFLPPTGSPGNRGQEISFPLVSAAFSAIGGMVASYSGKIAIHRTREASAGFIARKGTYADRDAQRAVLMNVSPFEEFRLALVEIPDADVDAFK